MTTGNQSRAFERQGLRLGVTVSQAMSQSQRLVGEIYGPPRRRPR